MWPFYPDDYKYDLTNSSTNMYLVHDEDGFILRYEN